MELFLQYFIWLPLVTFVMTLFIPKKHERYISLVTNSSLGIHLLSVIVFLFVWAKNQFPILDSRHFTLYRSETIEIFVNYFFDSITACYSLMGSSLALLVAIFSKYYLHRDEGYKRFFVLFNLFYLSYNIVIFSGNFETFFTGWEILGTCSFLLIAFYRERYLPMKNAMKAISIYRLGDICLILAMWMSHHLWHENITFTKLNNVLLIASHIQEHYWYACFISIAIVIAAAVKSAQIPFSSWLPRAMEGPTTSSAIFYGSLSVHIGAFLLLRTYPYWESLLPIKIMIILIGVITCVIASSITKVQSSVKTQIAYASITQIGIIFIEIAFGLHTLALIHISGNAFLRTYQLLVSPSVLNYLVHDMVFSHKIIPDKKISPLFRKIKNSVFILSLKEWNLDHWLQSLLWAPFKKSGKALQFLKKINTLIILGIFLLLGLVVDFNRSNLPFQSLGFLPDLFSFLGVALVLNAFVEKNSARYAWIFATLGQLYIALSVALINEDFDHMHILLYLSGVLVSSLIGLACLTKIKAIDGDISLTKYHGHIYDHPKIAFIFLVSCLAFVGLPFTPTFIGIDILFSHIHQHELLVITFTAISFLFMEISIIRIYTRIFLGQHKNPRHPVAYRSS